MKQSNFSETDFWELIEQSQNKDISQADFLVNKLSNYSETDIIQFERILRQKLLDLWHENIIAVCKIMLGYISDDTFLYFRCALILEGKNVFEIALQNSDNLVNKIKIQVFIENESLLYVSTQAFINKTGKIEEDETFPRYQNQDLDYDFGNFPIQGNPILEHDFLTYFPRLMKEKSNYKKPQNTPCFFDTKT